MTNTEVIKKLIGEINPVGESNEDERRLNNLHELCDVVENLLDEIHELSLKYEDDKRHSVKRISDKAYKFIQRMWDIHFNGNNI